MTQLASLRWLVVVSLAVVTVVLSAAEPAAEKKDAPETRFAAEDVAFFEKQVKPILEANCFKCHGGEKTRSGLQLTSREGILKGGDRGPAVALDQPESSLLLGAINYRGELKMPESGQLKKEQIDILTRWVKLGLPWTAGSTAVVKNPPTVGGKITDEARNYWAYKPIQRHELPAVKNKDWVKNPIDAFILAKLEARGLAPAPPADRIALVRRVYYDLTGLPPTPEEVGAFINDKSADAYEKLIDKLLASSQYGEKWGRHWLDLVRYAETNGYERDGPKPYAWRYRDYVIKSFNDDKPYDRFIKEQLAGDELGDELPAHNPDAIIATGYYRLGLWDDEPVDPKQARYDGLDDIVATTAQVFLGMTMNCARCHDHKIDPILQKDYYQMVAFFQDVPHYSLTRDVRSPFNLTDISPPEARAKYEAEMKQRDARKAELTKAMTKIEEEAIKKMPAEDQRATEGPDRQKVLDRKLKQYLTAEQATEYAKLKSELDELKKKPEPPRELALSVNNCAVNPPQSHVLIRGNPHVQGAPVEPAYPTIFAKPAPAIPAPAKDARTSGRRTVLAEWMTSKDNPATPRVMVNRLWQHHFGRGIVPSSNDFGKFGTLPTHPELLDWLADEMVKGGWTLKRMHKLIMLSNTYQMSSKGSEPGLKEDPSNTLFWRFNMRRLVAEEVRDSVLAVSGKLNLKMGGPSIYPPIPREVLAGQSVPGQGWGKSPPEEASRRSIYIHVKRSLLVPVLSQHDQADTDSSCPVRYTTTVPTQSLGMLNGEFTNEQTAFLADRLQREAPDDLEKQVRRAIRLTTGRTPTDDEVRKDVEFIGSLQTKAKLTEAQALRQYCLLAFNTNEFVYLD